MSKRAREQGDITIRWKGLDRTDLDDLYDLLKSQEGVTHVYTRVSKMDATHDPSIHTTLSMIVAFSVVIAAPVAHKALEVATDWVKEWLRNLRTENPVEIVVIYGADKRILRRIRRVPLPKVK
jgi:hypothetical protein